MVCGTSINGWVYLGEETVFRALVPSTLSGVSSTTSLSGPDVGTRAGEAASADSACRPPAANKDGIRASDRAKDRELMDAGKCEATVPLKAWDEDDLDAK